MKYRIVIDPDVGRTLYPGTSLVDAFAVSGALTVEAEEVGVLEDGTLMAADAEGPILALPPGSWRGLLRLDPEGEGGAA